MNTKPQEKLLYKNLSYQIQGAFIEVRKNFGPGHKESIYQNALAEELKSRNIKFEKEKSIRIFSPKTGKVVGYYKPDFIIENKIIVELKAQKKIERDVVDQLYDYLRNSEYELGYFVNFASPKLYIKRIIYTNDRKFRKITTNTNTNTRYRKLLAVISSILVAISVFAPSAQAAELNFDQQELHLPMAAEFSVKVLLNTNNENINALDVKLSYPDDILEVEDLIDGNSIVNFWVEKPRVENKVIRFAGIIPGGYAGENGLLLTIKFRSIKEGEGEISFVEDSQILLNDGLGTKADLKSKNLKILVKTSPDSKFQIPSSKLSDTEPPESFVPEIANDPAIFDGKWFLVFATQDKKSGIDHYEVKESRGGVLSKVFSIKYLVFRGWETAESPYVLKDQKLRSYIFVKAIDKAGNERIVKIPPKNPLKWYENWENWIIIIIAVFLFVVLKYLWNRKLKH